MDPQWDNRGEMSRIAGVGGRGAFKCSVPMLTRIIFKMVNQRTNGPVNAHLIYWPSTAQNIQNLENIWGKEVTLTFNTHIPS